MARTVRKATFSLPVGVLEGLDEALAAGAAASKNAFVEGALIHEIRETRRQQGRTEWVAALHDPLFLQDLKEVETDFAAADAETARQMR